SGIYLGFESGWDFDSVNDHFVATGTHSHWDRDVVDIGVYLGYQHQFGAFVLGVEFNFIGNEWGQEDRVFPTGVGNCPSALPRPTLPLGNGIGLNCVGRVSNVITIGPRLGYSVGKFMPYVTGGWATGSVDFRTITQAPAGSPPAAPGFAATT